MEIINSLDAKEGSSDLISDEIQQRKLAKDDWTKIIFDGGYLLETKVKGFMAPDG